VEAAGRKSLRKIGEGGRRAMTQLWSQVDGERRNSRQITARVAVHDLFCCAGFAASPLNYESGGQEFESLRARHSKQGLTKDHRL